MDKCLISVIIPVYNAERYIAACLDSLLDQQAAGYELLCIDDGSTDASPALLDRYSREHPQVRVIHKENGGVTTARNTGLEHARGDYIWFVDADDLVRRNILASVTACLTGAVQWDRVVLNGYTFTDALSQEELTRAEAGDLPCNVPWKDAVVWRSLLRREFLETHGLSFRHPELTHGEDGLFMYEVAAAGPRTLELGETGYFYRVHSGSAETAVSLENHRRKLRSYLRLTEILQGYYAAGRRDRDTANKLMSYLWFALYEAARMPREEANQALARLKELGLYPGRRLPECDLKSAYLMGGPGIVGRLLDTVCMHLHTPWGYGILRLLMTVKR